IVGRRSRREERDPVLRVDRNLAPRVRAAGVLPRIRRPCLIAVLAGARNRMKGPDERAREDVVGTDVAGRRPVSLAGVGPDHDQVLENASWTLVGAAEPAWAPH